MRVALAALLLAAPAVAAPVPADPPPNPLGQGYLGVYQSGWPVINELEPNTPAARAGLRPGDVIVRVGRLRSIQFEGVKDYISGQRPGTYVLLTVRRNGQELPIPVRLGARPAELAPQAPPPPPIDPFR